MSFSRVNSLGWALFEELTSSQMNTLDIDHSNAVDGLNGGTYALLSQLVFTGAKFSIASVFQAPGANMWNPVFFGADPTGAADSTSAIDAADAAAAASGGFVFFPPGTYKHNSSLNPSAGVTWTAAPGTVQLNLNHATVDQLIFNTGTPLAIAPKTVIENIVFGALVDNSGAAILISSGQTKHVLFRNCGWNVVAANAKLKGRIIYILGDDSQIELQGCRIEGKGDVSNIVMSADDIVLEVRGCTFVISSTLGASAAIIDAANGHSRLYDNVFDVTPHTGTARVISYGGFAYKHIAKGNYFKGSAFSGPCFHLPSTGIWLYESDSTFDTVNPYSISGLMALGSHLSLHSPIVQTIGGAGTVVCANGYKAISFRLTFAYAGLGPTVQLPAMYFIGQEFELTIWNDSGSDWVNGIAPTPAPGSSGTGSTSDGKLRTLRFRVLDVKANATPQWAQIGDPSPQLTPL